MNIDIDAIEARANAALYGPFGRGSVRKTAEDVPALIAEVRRLSQRPALEEASEVARREIAKGEYLMGGDNPQTYRPYQHSAERAVHAVIALFPTVDAE